MERLNQCEIIEIDSEEVDWLVPAKKCTVSFPDEIINSIKKSELNDRIIRKPNTDVYILYLLNQLFLFNSSNIKHLTNANIMRNEAKLRNEDLCVINFDKEIKKITINTHKPEMFCVIFEDIVQVYGFTNLFQFIASPQTGINLAPNLIYRSPSDKKNENVDAYVYDSVELKILINQRNQIIMYSPPNPIISDQNTQGNINNILLLENQIILVSESDSLYLKVFSSEQKKFIDLKRLNLKDILRSEDGNTDYKITYLTNFKNFICVGILEKQADENWNNFPELKQHFLFLDYASENNNISVNKIFKADWVFNYNDDYAFKIEPKYQSFFYEEYNVFILSSNQYHLAEIFYIEDEVDGTKIVRGEFADDQRICLPKDITLDKMSLFQGIQIVDFKHDNYESEKINISSEELYTPPLIISLNNKGNISVFYLNNKRDTKCVLKAKSQNIKSVFNKKYDFKTEDKKSEKKIDGTLFMNNNISPPNNLSVPKDSPDLVSTRKIPPSNIFAKNLPSKEDEIKIESEKSFGPNFLTGVDASKETSKTKEKNKITSKETSPLSIQDLTQIKNDDEAKKALEKKRFERDEENAKQEAAKKEKELWLNIKFKRLETNLKRKLDIYKNVIFSHYENIIDLLSSLEKKVNLTKSEKDLNSFISLSENVCKEFLDLNEIFPDFKKYQEKMSFIIKQKDLIDKIARDADKHIPNFVDIDKLLASYKEENSEEINVLESNKEKMRKLETFKKDIEQLKIFLQELKEFQSEFSEMNTINKKIKNNNKYEGIFKKFKSVETGENNKLSNVPIKSSNLSQYSVNSQSSIFELIMKKFEEIFTNFDHRFYKEIKPKLDNILHETNKINETKSNRSVNEGFSISDLDITMTYQRIKDDPTYLGNNPIDNIFFYKTLKGKFSNILHNHNSKVTIVDSKYSKKNKLEEFFTKSNKSNTASNKLNESNISHKNIPIHSESYLKNVLEKVKKKKQERDKLKLDLEFKVEEFIKMERIKMQTEKGKEIKENATQNTNPLVKNESEKKKALILDGKSIIPKNDSSRNISLKVNDKEKQIEKKEEIKKKEDVISGLDKKRNILNVESKENLRDEKSTNKLFGTNNNKKEDKIEEKENKFNLIFGKSKEAQGQSDSNKTTGLFTKNDSSNLFSDFKEIKPSIPDDSNKLLQIIPNESKSNLEENMKETNINKDKMNDNKKTEENKLNINIFGMKNEKNNETQLTKDNKIPDNKKATDNIQSSNNILENKFDTNLNIETSIKQQNDNKPNVNVFGLNPNSTNNVDTKEQEENKNSQQIDQLSINKSTNPNDNNNIFKNNNQNNLLPNNNNTVPNLNKSGNPISENKNMNTNPSIGQNNNITHDKILQINNNTDNKLNFPNNDKVDNNNNTINKGENNSKNDNKFNIPNSLDTDFKPNLANGTNPTTTANNFSGLQLNNNLFGGKQAKPTELTGKMGNFIPSNIANNPLSNVQTTNIQSTNVTNLMEKPGFGAKSNLGMINPLNVNFFFKF